jgi:hypothetical protein
MGDSKPLVSASLSLVQELGLQVLPEIHRQGCAVRALPQQTVNLPEIHRQGCAAPPSEAPARIRRIRRRRRIPVSR